MLDKNTLIKVTNRDHGTVCYHIADLNNLTRVYTSNETKEITMEELRKLSYTTGGAAILRDCLVIDNKEAVAELLGEVEPEYHYSIEDVKNILVNGSLDQLLDTLDFAPNGVLDLIKDLAVKLEINDIQKREAILEKTGFNVTKAIEINHESAKVEEEAPKTRRVAVEGEKTETAGPVRRVIITK